MSDVAGADDAHNAAEAADDAADHGADHEVRPLLRPADLDRLRTALAGYTTGSVDDLLGPVGRAAHQRGDLAGVARVVRLAADAGPAAVFTRLFLLGADVSDREAADAFGPLPLDAAVSAGIVERGGDRVRARVEIRPYGEADVTASGIAGVSGPWWVVSDLGSDVRPGPLAHDHVLGIGNAALTLAQATPRPPSGEFVDHAVDIGTGCGVQALHLAKHARRVTATDISARALRFAATTAVLSGHQWDLRRGSLTEPLAGTSADLIVANPPFVISPGTQQHASGGTIAEYEYRDSGRAGDAVCRELVSGMFELLRPGGTAQLLANWVIPLDGSWQDRVAGWFPPGATAWVWQREVADPGEYVTLWLRDAGLRPGTPGWTTRYDSWLDWFGANGVAAVGMGLITMRKGLRPDDAPADVTAEDVPQAVEQPVGAEIAAWLDRRRFVAASHLGETDGGPDLLRTRLEPAPGLVLTRHDTLPSDTLTNDPLPADGGWTTARATLRQSHGMRWEIEVDEAVTRIVAACAAGATPQVALDVLAAIADDDASDLARRFEPVLRDLVQRGLLLPTDGGVR